MADALKHPTAEEVEAFLACDSQDEKCRHFHAHPNLGLIFRAVHFPKPADAPEAVPAATQPN